MLVKWAPYVYSYYMQIAMAIWYIRRQIRHIVGSHKS